MNENLNKYKGVIPAFYACYDENDGVSEERTKNLAVYLYEKGVKGLYVGGSSGECIYQSIEERKRTLKYVAEKMKGKLTLIAHVGAPSTKDSVALAKYASELGYDALSAIPPIYYKLPESSIYTYWTKIIDSTELPFIIYNIPQTTGYNLSINLFERLLENKKVIGVKNSSMPALDIERFKTIGGNNVIVFNGPDEQYVSGRLIGADAGIGGTYAVMPELFLIAEEYVSTGRFADSRAVQREINNIIIALNSLNGSMYAVIKQILKIQGVNVGSVREPMSPVIEDDLAKIEEIRDNINQAILNFSS
ncbi:N-acetylneuraminate lyase [Aquibacillus halophilus]|uniref:N-acetylneuraminate lyase n=1 Tax=Aquibacillus halophilus TaxID=930132 RepID=A0A6A8DE22_9BACI|nr:dihydrodipicolinate synthase family protein [Aquibacillus halophilus]MRH41167.1 N-acetylneuraminate lyase [Aquibacillus halophilus]